MEEINSTTLPLYIQKEGEQSSKIALSLTRASYRFIVRLTGGCGYMSASDAEGLYGLFTEAFQGYGGAFLFGGTRMLKKGDPQIIIPGITEIPPLIRASCPEAVFLGVVPKTDDIKISDHGLIVSGEKGKDFFTIIHPDQDLCLVVQKSVDQESPWDAEYKECLRIIGTLRSSAAWESLLISYNGGTTTKKEITAHAAAGWPVLLITGSGRVTDELASDQEFLAQNPSVQLVVNNAESLRQKLYALGALKDSKEKQLRLVEKGVFYGQN